MTNFKKKLLDKISNSVDTLDVSIIYDCSQIFSLLNKINDLEYKKIVAKSFSEYLWVKYVSDEKNSYPEGGLIDFTPNGNVRELLMDTINFLNFVSDNNQDRIEFYSQRVSNFIDSYGKDSK